MPTVIRTPVMTAAAGEPPKMINEYVGRLGTATSDVSIARMESPSGWSEPAQIPQFDEYTIVLAGFVRVEHDHGVDDVTPGQVVAVSAGERVRYSTPDGARYLAVCLPAFAAETVHRDDTM